MNNNIYPLAIVLSGQISCVGRVPVSWARLRSVAAERPAETWDAEPRGAWEQQLATSRARVEVETFAATTEVAARLQSVAEKVAGLTGINVSVVRERVAVSHVLLTKGLQCITNNRHCTGF